MYSRFAWLPLLLPFVFYPAIAWPVLRFAGTRYRMPLFALVNVVGAYLACLAGLLEVNAYHKGVVIRVVGEFFVTYLFLILVNYWLLRRAKEEHPVWGPAALVFPILSLVLIKYIPSVDTAFRATLHSISVARISVLFLGLSYLTFRLMHLVQEVRNGLVEMPTLSEYLSFALFVPTLSVGPINPYSRFIASVQNPINNATLINRALLRIMVGLVKYIFLSTLLAQYTYNALLLDGHPHHRMDFFVALFAYTLYLYCNFSGFCDMVVGVAGLIGIDVIENFNRPFAARNLQEFWANWHISLSSWLRDMMFTPMVKVLVRRFGPSSANHVIAFSVFAVFVAIGMWHGFGLNFLLFGVSQGVGLALVHYYTVFLKSRLGKKGLAAYRANRLIRAAGTVITFVYFSASLFLFANSIQNMHRIFSVLV